MQSHSVVTYRAVKCVALLIIVSSCRPPDVGGRNRELPSEYNETVTSGSGEKISFKMVPIPGGTFLMGSPQDEPGRKDDEGPQHQVRVDSFYLCATETTLELFMVYYEEMINTGGQAEQGKDEIDAITGPTPVYGDLTMGYGKKHPAMGMTWHNAKTFCEWLSKRTGRKYRLPTEAEWEYACRAGTTNVFACGDDPNRLADFAWYKNSSDSETHEVGRKTHNAWRLYDMLGNVREWVNDFYNSGAYTNTTDDKPTINPQGPEEGEVHVARGGDYRSPIEDLRCAARAFEKKWWRDGDPQIPKSRWWLPQMDFIGFRVAASVDPK
ncbi:MAG: formylglycine-generating enzyme family protein [Planctomycetota bacterium]|jgi:formylglycine-generating enzyme required for sulfatase activity